MPFGTRPKLKGSKTVRQMYHFLAFFTICIWGTTFVSTKLLLQAGLSPTSIFVWRFAMAYVGMLALSHRRLFCRSWRDEAIMMVAGLTGGYLYFITENTALKCAPAGIISLIVCLAPLFTALGALFTANKSGLTRRLWWGMAIALGGVALVVGRGEGPGANNMLLGGGLALMAAALWAVYQHVVKPLADKYGTALLTRKVFGYGLLAAIIGEPLLSLVSDAHGYSVIVAEVSPAITRPLVWGNLLFLGLIASLACYFIWNKVAQQLGAVVSANYIYLNPLTTCLFSALFLGEPLTPMIVLGGTAILLGVWLAVGQPADKDRLHSAIKSK